MPKNQINYRQEFNSPNMLIEIAVKEETNDLILHTLETIWELNPILKIKEDLWMNEEYLFTYSTTQGEFQVSIDIWGFAFILSKNTDLIHSIFLLLKSSFYFELNQSSQI